MKPWLLVLLGFVLAVSVALAVLPRFFSDHRQTLTEPLAAVIPARLEGWEVRDLDLADSEEMRSAVLRILRFDEVVYRGYRRGGTEVQIYAAYWKPGSVPYGQAGVHTPDTCWVNAGWRMDKREHAQSVRVDGAMLKPVEIGDFSKNGHRLHVMFWHLVGVEVHGYEQYGWRSGLAGVRARLPNLFRDLRRYGFNLAQEQKFLRISSNVPVRQLFNDPAFSRLMRGLEVLGIFVDEQPAV